MTLISLIQLTLAIFHKYSDKDQNKSVHSLLEGKTDHFLFLLEREGKKGSLKWGTDSNRSLCQMYVISFAITQIHVCRFSIRRRKCSKSLYRNHIVCRSKWKISCWNFDTYPSPSVFTVLSGNRILLCLLISRVLELLQAGKCKRTWWD